MHMSNKMQYFSFKDGCGVRGCMRIEVFKRRVDFAAVKQVWAVVNKTIIPLRNELKSKTVLCLKQFCEHCYIFLNSISYYIFRVRFQDCFVKVCLCSIL